MHHLSLFPESGHNTDVGAGEDEDAPAVLPWQNQERKGQGVAGVYRRYLDDRSDSVIEALRVIANSDGATIVHCAAGKDRTGTVVAMALAEVGRRARRDRRGLRRHRRTHQRDHGPAARLGHLRRGPGPNGRQVRR